MKTGSATSSKSTVDDFIGLGPRAFAGRSQGRRDLHRSRRRRAEWNIYHAGRPRRSGRPDRRLPGIDLVSHDEVGRLIGRIAEEANRRRDDSFPEMDATLADGSRVHANHPKVSPNGWSLNIRKFSKDKLTAEDLLERGAMSEPMYMFLKSAVTPVRTSSSPATPVPVRPRC